MKKVYPKAFQREEIMEESDDILEHVQNYLEETERMSKESGKDLSLIRAQIACESLRNILMESEYRHASFCDDNYWNTYMSERIKQYKKIVS